MHQKCAELDQLPPLEHRRLLWTKEKGDRRTLLSDCRECFPVKSLSGQISERWWDLTTQPKKMQSFHLYLRYLGQIEILTMIMKKGGVYLVCFFSFLLLAPLLNASMNYPHLILESNTQSACTAIFQMKWWETLRPCWSHSQAAGGLTSPCIPPSTEQVGGRVVRRRGARTGGLAFGEYQDPTNK